MTDSEGKKNDVVDREAAWQDRGHGASSAGVSNIRCSSEAGKCLIKKSRSLIVISAIRKNRLQLA
jgi:hypothetical protein